MPNQPFFSATSFSTAKFDNTSNTTFLFTAKHNNTTSLFTAKHNTSLLQHFFVFIAKYKYPLPNHTVKPTFSEKVGHTQQYNLSFHCHTQHLSSTTSLCTGWRRGIGCLKLQVIFRKRATMYRALSRKMTSRDKASYDSTPPCIAKFDHTTYSSTAKYNISLVQ